MLVVGAVVRTRRKQNDPGFLDAPGETPQMLQKFGGIALDGANRGCFEEFRGGLSQHRPRLKAVGHTRDVADVILDDHPASAGIASQVEGGDMHEGVVGNGQAHRVALVTGVVVDQLEGHHSILQGLLGIVDVAEKFIPHPNALDHSAREELPRFWINDPRKQVVGEDPVGGIVFVVEGEGDSKVPHQTLTTVAETLQFLGFVLGKVIPQSAVDLRAHALGQQCLVKGLDGSRVWAFGRHRFGLRCAVEPSPWALRVPTLFQRGLSG